MQAGLPGHFNYSRHFMNSQRHVKLYFFYFQNISVRSLQN